MREFYARFLHCQATTSLFDTFLGTPARHPRFPASKALPTNLIENTKGYNIHPVGRKGTLGVGFSTR
jgi:hypothetical protein